LWRASYEKRAQAATNNRQTITVLIQRFGEAPLSLNGYLTDTGKRVEAEHSPFPWGDGKFAAYSESNLSGQIRSSDVWPGIGLLWNAVLGKKHRFP
jgi:hypothetical protein